MSLGLLGAAYCSSSSSSSSSSGSEDEQPKIPLEKSRGKLANPFSRTAPGSLRPSYMVTPEDMTAVNKEDKMMPNEEDPVSVFTNTFKAKEDRKRAILERHVEMTTKQEDLKTIHGKKVCWNFRKGRCRFGHKCTFAHDSDVAKLSSSSGCEEASTSSGVDASERGSHLDWTQTSAVIQNNKRRGKHGLSDSLTPGKKAMKFYNKLYGDKS